MLRSAFFLLSLATSILVAQPTSNEGWIHLQSSDGIDIYQRIEPSGAISIQATATLEAPIADLLPYVQKPENFSTWLAEVSASGPMTHPAFAGTLVHFSLEPASSATRFDVVAEYATALDKESFVGKLTNRPELSATEAGFERMNEFQGYLILRSVDATSTQLTMKFTAQFDETLTQSQAIRELKAFTNESAANLALKTVPMVIR